MVRSFFELIIFSQYLKNLQKTTSTTRKLGQGFSISSSFGKNNFIQRSTYEINAVYSKDNISMPDIFIRFCYLGHA
jgi:hypothetical protein